MPNYRLSFIFEAGQAGWSEQWYLSASGDPSSIPERVLTPQFLGGFLGPRAAGVYFMAMRVNDADVPRRSFLAIKNINCKNYSLSVDPLGEEPPVAALGYVLTAGSRKRSVMVRGLVDASIARDVSDMLAPTGEIVKQLAAYAQAIIGAQLCVRVLSPPAGNNPDRSVVSFAPKQGDPGSTTVTYNDFNPINPTQPVIFHGISQTTLPGYSGPLPAFNVTPTSFDVPIAWRSPAVVLPMRNTTVRNAQYTLDPVAGIWWEDMRTKKVGRPILLSRGRRSGVRYRSR